MRLLKLAPKPTVQWSEVGSEVVILDRTMAELLRLNPLLLPLRLPRLGKSEPVTRKGGWSKLDGRRLEHGVFDSSCIPYFRGPAERKANFLGGTRRTNGGG